VGYDANLELFRQLNPSGILRSASSITRLGTPAHEGMATLSNRQSAANENRGQIIGAKTKSFMGNET
jgi:hypothetical protein